LNGDGKKIPMSSLDGLRVLDLTSYLSGPYCAMLLGDHGADVIKVERPQGGDDVRGNPPFHAGQSAPFMMWNRNKRSIVLDLKDERDREQLLALADQADVIVENFRPGTLENLGLGYETLRGRNPRLIYAAISGFGHTGPLRDAGGFDLIMQGMSGLASVCGPIDGPPHRLPFSVSDVTAGMFLALGVLLALQARHRTGRGQMVETSLFEAALSMGLDEAAHVFATGTRPPRVGQAHRGGAPYRIFATGDGHITIGAGQAHFWRRFVKLIGKEELEHDPRFLTNADRVRNGGELTAIIEERLATRSAAEWLKLLAEAGIPSGPVLHWDESLAHPQALAREMVVEVAHPAVGPFRTIGIPVKLSETPGSIRRPAPLLGEHTDEILASLDAGAPEGRQG